MSNDELNSDITEIVNGKDGADAAKLTFLYQLTVYENTSDKSSLPSRINSSFSDRRSATDILSDVDIQHHADTVKNAILSKLNKDSATLGMSDLLDATYQACKDVIVSQFIAINNGTNATNVTSIVDMASGAMKNAKLMDSSHMSHTRALDDYIIDARTVFDSRVAPTMSDDVLRNALFSMLKPWLCMQYLSEFVPENGSMNIYSGFKPNYQDMQYARLAAFRAMFDLVDALLQYNQGLDSASQQDLARLTAVAMRLSETLGSEFIARRNKQLPKWQNEVATASKSTKTLSVQLYEINAQLEKRKSNLLVMLQNQRELQKEAARKRWVFWILLLVFVIVTSCLVFLLAFRKYFVLYVLSSLVIVVPLLYFVITLVMRTLRGRG